MKFFGTEINKKYLKIKERKLSAKKKEIIIGLKKDIEKLLINKKHLST